MGVFRVLAIVTLGLVVGVALIVAMDDWIATAPATTVFVTVASLVVAFLAAVALNHLHGVE